MEERQAWRAGTANYYVSDHLRVCRLTLGFCGTVKETAIYYFLFDLATLLQAESLYTVPHAITFHMRVKISWEPRSSNLYMPNLSYIFKIANTLDVKQFFEDLVLSCLFSSSLLKSN